MTPSLSVVILMITLSLALAWLVKRFGSVRQCYHNGVGLWRRWLPVCATGVYLAILTVNLASGGSTSEPALSLNGFFSIPEIIVLFLAGPLFLTRPGAAVAAGTLLYSLERLLLAHHPGSTPALALMTGAVTLVSVLGDQMPWLADDGPNRLAGRLRSVLLLLLTLGAFVTLIAALVKTHALARWLSGAFGIAVPSALALALVVALCIGWLGIGLGFVRHLMIPLVSMPTLFVLAYVSDWPSHLLAVPFATCFGLSLVMAERRLLSTRRGGGVATTVVLAR